LFFFYDSFLVQEEYDYDALLVSEIGMLVADTMSFHRLLLKPNVYHKLVKPAINFSLPQKHIFLSFDDMSNPRIILFHGSMTTIKAI
jgi:hypothetical protein